jgi:hypothetical protein
MANSKRTGKSYVSGYARYNTSKKETTNRVARLTKLAKENPNNLQIATAIKNVVHRRGKPVVRYWSHSMRRMAQLVKQYTGKFDRGLFSADPVIHTAATRTRNENAFAQYKEPTKPVGSMFSLKERAVWK